MHICIFVRKCMQLTLYYWIAAGMTPAIFLKGQCHKIYFLIFSWFFSHIVSILRRYSHVQNLFGIIDAMETASTESKMIYVILKDNSFDTVYSGLKLI